MPSRFISVIELVEIRIAVSVFVLVLLFNLTSLFMFPPPFVALVRSMEGGLYERGVCSWGRVHSLAGGGRRGRRRGTGGKVKYERIRNIVMKGGCFCELMRAGYC